MYRVPSPYRTRLLQLAGGPPPAMLLVMHGTDEDGLGRVGQFSNHPEQLQVEILGRMGAAAVRVVHERDHRLLTPGQTDSDVPVVIAAHRGDRTGADDIGAIVLGDPDIRRSHMPTSLDSQYQNPTLAAISPNSPATASAGGAAP